MKNSLQITTLLAAGFLMAAPLVAAQPAPIGLGTSNCAITSTNAKGGQISVGVQGRDTVDSSRFTEYREVPKGVSVPCFNLFSKTDKLDFTLFGYNVSQDDQRYKGWFKTNAFDLIFDYNSIVHHMGNDAHTIQTELSEGVWGMSDTLQQAIGTTTNATPTTGRIVTFYDTLLNPSFASAGSVDITALRQRGSATFDLSKKLPFNLSFTYMRELKSGYRGEEGGALFSAVSPVIEIPSPLNELTQDIGVRVAKNFDKGNLHASFARNLYNNLYATEEGHHIRSNSLRLTLTYFLK